MEEQLARYGKLLRDHFQEEKPELFMQMEQKGTLMPFLLEREEKAIKHMDNLMDQGLNQIEAREMIWEELMALP